MLYALGQKRQQMPFNKFKNKIKKSNHARFPCHTIHPFLSLLPPPLHALRRLYIPPEVSLFFFSHGPRTPVQFDALLLCSVYPGFCDESPI